MPEFHEMTGMLLEPYHPPRYTIDLSSPPKDRYRQLAREYKDCVQELTGLFNALLHDVAVPDKYIPAVNSLSNLLLRRVYDKSQTEELRGISEECGMPMYLLVAFNVILDLLMGCTSGGVRSLERNEPFSQARMLHFRTLDWTMDPLRKVVVQLDFVRSKSETPNTILASSITYVGFIGVLTGVRPGLSMSLNFRGIHDNSTRYAEFRFYFHHLLVLLGRRPSIATYLRRYLTGDHEKMEQSSRQSRKLSQEVTRNTQMHSSIAIADVCDDLSKRHTTAAYLIFCDGDSTVSIDKDFRTTTLRRSTDFIATTNHDVVDHDIEQKENFVVATAVQTASRHAIGLEEFLDESADRHRCIADRWKRLVQRRQRESVRNHKNLTPQETGAQTAITKRQVIEWISKYPTANECTHYATVMDPKQGTIAWCTAYPEPLGVESQLLL